MSVAPQPSIFGAIVDGGDVERWTLALLKRWLSTYLAETERQHGIVAGKTPRPRGWAIGPSFDKWPEDQVPGILVVSPGTSAAPIKDGGGYYRARWLLDVGALCSTRSQAETRAQAQLYGGAITDLLIQRPSLDDHAHGTLWLGLSYEDLGYDDTRSLSAVRTRFTVEVEQVALANAGPTLPDEPLDPDTLPWPPYVDVETVDVVVENTPPPDPIPDEGGTT